MATSHSVIEELMKAEEGLEREPVPGLFDTEYPPYGFDDVDLCMRLSFIGKKFLVAGDVFAYHYGGIGSRSLSGDALVDSLTRGMQRYSRKFS